jgi:hypothetical protein
MAATSKQIVDFLLANPNMSDADIAQTMATFGVSPADMAKATGVDEGIIAARVAYTLPPNQAVLLGDTYVQAINETTGSGQEQQVGGLQNVITYKEGENKTGGAYNQYTPTGNLERTGTQLASTANADFLKFLLAAGGMAGGGALLDSLGLGGASTLAADADLAAGLLPEFGTNAAYNAFMTSAMTPEALAALQALVTANPEIIGSGAILTNLAAGLPATGLLPTVIPSTVTPTTVTPVTPVTPPTVPPTVPPVVPPVVTPPVVTPPFVTPSISDVIKTIGTVATIAAIPSIVSPKTTTPTGFDIVPIPEDWKTPNKATTAPFTALTPINFGTQNLLKNTQFEKFLDPNYGQVPEAVKYSQPSNLSYNVLMGILGSRQGMPSASNLSINDIISGIQNQYGQTPKSTMG